MSNSRTVKWVLCSVVGLLLGTLAIVTSMSSDAKASVGVRFEVAENSVLMWRCSRIAIGPGQRKCLEWSGSRYVTDENGHSSSRPVEIIVRQSTAQGETHGN